MVNVTVQWPFPIAPTSFYPPGLTIISGEGCWLTANDGKRYLDLISGIGVSNLGHRHPHITTAIHRQIDRYAHVMVYGELFPDIQLTLAEKLCRLLPGQLNCVYLVNSGTEAVEGALKLARLVTGRYEIISFINAYHGSTHGALSVMGADTLRQPFMPLLPAVKRIPFNDTRQLSSITSHTAAVIIEPVQGEAGVIPAEPEFLQALRNRCDETGALLIMDEIQTAMGRCGAMFCFEQYGIIPDILLLAKALGGGLPLGAFISSRERMLQFATNPPLGHLTTFGGNPVSCAAALAALEVLVETPVIYESLKKAERFEQLLDGNLVKEIRRKGFMIAVDLGDAGRVEGVVRYCLEHGVLTDWFLFNPASIRIYPSLIISDEEIAQACAVLNSALASV